MDGQSMDEHLKKLLQNTTAIRYRQIHEHVQLALDTLETQKVSFAFKAWQIREKCVSVLKEALESNNPSLISIGLHAIEYAVFHPDLDGVTGEDDWDAMDARIFVLQVLDALNCLPYLEPEYQVHGLKILLGLCCDFVPSFDGELIIKIVQMCLACWHKDNDNIHSSLLQLCAAYTLYTQKFCAASCNKQNVDSDVLGAAESLASQAVDKLAQADMKGGEQTDKLVDVIGLAKFFVQQINRAQSDSQRALYLECLLSVLKTLKSSFVRKHEMFGNLIRQDLCPTLASVICLSQVGSKTRLMTSKKFLMRKQKINNSKKMIVTRSLMLHRKVALLSVELVRLVGCVASLRPHVAVIFTHLLSSAAISQHGVPYLIMKQLWQKPDILFDLAGPFIVQDVEEKQNTAGILQLIIHAMSQSCTASAENNQQVINIQSSVSAVNKLLETLEEARNGKSFRDEQVMHFTQPQYAQTLSDDELSCCSSSDNLVSAAEEQFDEMSLDQNPSVADCEETRIEDDKRNMRPLDKQGNPVIKSISEIHRSYLSEDDDVWLSSEDLRSIASPCYQSAAEGDESMENINTLSNDDVLSSSTNTATDDESDAGTVNKESDGDIDKYMEEAISTRSPGGTDTLTHGAEEERDRIISRRHIDYLREILPQLLKSPDVATVDQELQQAASLFCHEIYATWKVECLSVQADSLYILCYATLLLALRLHLNGHYRGSGVQLPCVKSQWVNFQQTSGIYLSRAWLSETFKEIISNDLFGESGYDISEKNPIVPLVASLIEIDGSVKSADFGQQNNTSPTFTSTPSHQHHKQASKTGSEFARQVAVSTWNLILDILQSSFAYVQGSNGGISNSLYLVFSPSSLRMRTSREHDVIISSLDGLRCAVELTCSLGIHSYAGAVLGQMVEACVPEEYSLRGKNPLLGEDDTEKHVSYHRLHMCHVLCMDAVIDVAPEAGCHSPNRWKSIFRLVSYVSYLESIACKDVSISDMHKFTSQTNVNIADLVKENSGDIKWGSLSSGAAQLTSLGFLTQERSVQAIHILSNKIDGMFEQASEELNLFNIVNFTRQLASASHEQLHSSPSNATEAGFTSTLGTPLLFRLGENMLRCAKSRDRPLLHIGSVWNLSAPHFAKAVGHSNHQIAKQAITYIHDTVSCILTPADQRGNTSMSLWGDKEPMYFHLNEALLQPFERAMQLESCDQGVQDQIACSIAELVEASSNRIASGWRPLFSALRNIPFSNHQPLSKSPVLEVLNSFFNASRAPSVFANAAHDCIRCLLKMLTSIEDEVSDDGISDDKHQRSTSALLCRYLEDIFDILTKMHQDGTRENFNESAHVDVTPACAGDGAVWKKLTTPVWCCGDDRLVEDAVDELEQAARKSFKTSQDDGQEPIFDQSAAQKHCVHDNTGLLATWFSLMDGLVTSVLTSSHHTQPIVLDLLCKLLEKCWDAPGKSYCLHILLHSCFPTLHSWIARLLNEHDDVSVTSRLASYKHMYGTVMELVADIIQRQVLEEATRISNHQTDKTSVDVMVHDMVNNLWTAYVNLCVESIQTRKEHLAKLGCACLRHILASIGNHMTANMISDACRCLSFVVDDCLLTINALVGLYDENRADELLVEMQEPVSSSICDPSCLSRVFQSNVYHPKSPGFESHQECYVTCNDSLCRVSLCEMACDLSSLHLLVKCIEHVTLGETRSPWQRSIPYAHHNRQHNNNAERGDDSTSLLHSTTNNAHHSPDDVTGRQGNQLRDRPLPVLLDYMHASEIHSLCSCVAKCYVVARNFDRHKNLQRLVQKLGKFYSSANLFQFASLTFDTYLRIILSLTSHSTSQHHSPNLQRSKSHSSTTPTTSGLLLADLLPEITCIQDGGHLKSVGTQGDNLSWAFRALNQTLDVISGPWGDVTTTSPSQEPVLMMQESLWEKQEASSDSMKRSDEDSMRSVNSDVGDGDHMSIDLDYMAYVKKSNFEHGNENEILSNSEQRQSLQSPTPMKPSVGKRMYAVAGEKTIGRLINAYKKHKQQQAATTAVTDKQKGIPGTDTVGHVTRARSISESSSSVVGSDEREVEREAWCNVVAATLRLLTSAPDHVLTKLLPVVYEPLTALAKQQNAAVTQEGCDVGSAFHQWLLRVGALCQLVEHD